MKDIFTLRQEAIRKIEKVLEEFDTKAKELDPFCLLPRSHDEQRDALAATDALLQIRTSVRLSEKRSREDIPGPFRTLMDPKFELPSRQLLEKLFSQYEAGDICQVLRVDRRAIKRWLTGETVIPETCWRQFLLATGEVMETPYQILKKTE
jgi:hypothetical protein